MVLKNPVHPGEILPEVGEDVLTQDLTGVH